jgi:hypothetical protein
VREGELRGVVEAAAHKVGVINEAGLHRVAQCYSEHQITTAATHVVRHRQRHAEIVRRVAGFGWGQEVVHEIDVAHERGVPAGRVDRVRLSAADQRAAAGAAELGDLLATGLDRPRAKGSDAAAQRVQDWIGSCLRDSAERSVKEARAAYLARAST